MPLSRNGVHSIRGEKNINRNWTFMESIVGLIEELLIECYEKIHSNDFQVNGEHFKKIIRSQITMWVQMKRYGISNKSKHTCGRFCAEHKMFVIFVCALTPPIGRVLLVSTFFCPLIITESDGKKNSICSSEPNKAIWNP